MLNRQLYKKILCRQLEKNFIILLFVVSTPIALFTLSVMYLHYGHVNTNNADENSYTVHTHALRYIFGCDMCVNDKTLKKMTYKSE